MNIPLSTIQSRLDGSEYQMQQFSEYSDYLSIARDMLEKEKTYEDLNQEQKDVLYNLAEYGNFYPAAYARAILLRDNPEYVYEEPVILPEVNAYRKAKPVISSTVSSDYEFAVYPNPAYDYVIIDYKLKTGDKTAVLRISDNTGKVIKTISIDKPIGQQVIECSGITSGLYNFSLITKKKTVLSRKINIHN